MGFEIKKVNANGTYEYELEVTHREGDDQISIDLSTQSKLYGISGYAGFPLTRSEALALAAHLTGLASTILRDQEEATRK